MFSPQTNPNQHPNPNGYQTDRELFKKLGLPGYSSHQFSVSVETELVTNDDIPGASARLYQTLQSSVDEQIQAPGFIPPLDYAMDPPAAPNGQPPSASRDSSSSRPGR